MAYFQRPTAARDLYSFGRLNRSTLESARQIEGAVPAGGSALPVMATVVQEYTTGDREQTAVICGGIVEKFGTATNVVYGVMVRDGISGETESFVTGNAKISMQVNGALTIVPGELAYILDASRLVTNVAAGAVLIGRFIEARVTNPDGLVGEFAVVELDQ